MGRVYDNTSGQIKHKCNFDVELTIDALDGIAYIFRENDPLQEDDTNQAIAVTKLQN